MRNAEGDKGRFITALGIAETAGQQAIREVIGTAFGARDNVIDAAEVVGVLLAVIE